MHTKNMSERWLLLQLDDRSGLPEFVGQTGYHELQPLELPEQPSVGFVLPLPRGGSVRILWVDPTHHHVGVERYFPLHLGSRL